MPSRTGVVGNVSNNGMVTRVVIGIVLLALPILRLVGGFWAGAFVVGGIVELLSAYTRTCPLSAAWNMWFGSRGGAKPFGEQTAPPRYTGGGPKPREAGSQEQGGRGEGGRGEGGRGERGSEGHLEAGVEEPDAFSGGLRGRAGDGDKDG